MVLCDMSRWYSRVAIAQQAAERHPSLVSEMAMYVYMWTATAEDHQCFCVDMNKQTMAGRDAEIANKFTPEECSLVQR